MPATVLLHDVVEALEMQFDESSSYLDLDAGGVVNVSHDLLREAEEPGAALAHSEISRTLFWVNVGVHKRKKIDIIEIEPHFGDRCLETFIVTSNSRVDVEDKVRAGLR